MKRLLCLLLLMSGLVGWPVVGFTADQPSGASTNQESPREQLQEGLELYRSGQLEAALSQLRGYVVRYPDAPGLKQASLTLARIFLQSGRPGDALLYLQRIPEAERDPEVRLVEGRALVAAGDVEAGRRQLQDLVPADLTVADRGGRLESLARADQVLGRPLQALALLHLALPLEPDGRERLLAWGRQLLRAVDEDTLAEAAFMFQGQALGADAVLQQAQRADRRGERDTARRLIEAVVQGQVVFPYRREAVKLYESLTGRTWLQRSIGVLLPLTGKYATFGELVRRGMELAQAGHAGQEPPVQLVFRDVGSDPEGVAGAVDALTYEAGVMAIAGPITGSAAQAAATRAQQEGVPLLTLSQRDGLPEIGNDIFRDTLTPRLQAEALARYAIEERGLVRFGVLLPDNRLGQEMTDLFVEAVTRRGGEVVAREAYPEDATDFRRQIRLLMGKDPDAQEEDQPPLDPLEDLFVPDEPPLPFDALFIPDYADKIGLIAPQLPFYGIENVPLLGINGWNSPELLRNAGPYVEGAVFVDGFFVHSPSPVVRSFVADYLAKYQEEPTILEAQGYDAAGILLDILSDPAVGSRDAVRRSLQRVRNYPGVTGTTSFDLNGEAEKDLFLLQIHKGRIEQINPVPGESGAGN